MISIWVQIILSSVLILCGSGARARQDERHHTTTVTPSDARNQFDNQRDWNDAGHSPHNTDVINDQGGGSPRVLATDWGFVPKGGPNESVFPSAETCTPQSAYVEIWTVRPLDLSHLKVIADCREFIPTIDKDKTTSEKVFIKILFLPHKDGDIHCSLKVSLGNDEKLYSLHGSAVTNRYGVAPIRIVLNSSLAITKRVAVPIEVYNPRDSTLQIEEIMLLENKDNSHVILDLPDGDEYPNLEAWQIKPGEKRRVIFATFQSLKVGTFYDFLRITTNFDTLFVPVEFEVVKEDGLSIHPHKLDFRNIYDADSKTLSLSLRNAESVPVTTQSLFSPGGNLDHRLSLTFQSVTVAPGQASEFAKVSLYPIGPGQVDATLRLFVNSSTGSSTLDVGISGNVVVGSLGFLDEQTKFQSGKKVDTMKPFLISNNFTAPLVIQKAFFSTSTNLSLSFADRLPLTLAAGQQALLGTVHLPALREELSAPALIVTTNLTTVSIPFSVFHGRLHCVAHRKKGKRREQLCGRAEWGVDLSSVRVSEKASVELEIINRNPVNVTIDSWLPGKNVQVIKSLVEDLETASVPIRQEIADLALRPPRIGPNQRLRLTVEVTCTDPGFAVRTLDIVTMRDERIRFRFTYKGVIGDAAFFPATVLLEADFAKGGKARKSVSLRSTLLQHIRIYGFTSHPLISVELLSETIFPDTKSSLCTVSFGAPILNDTSYAMSAFSEGLTRGVKQSWRRRESIWAELESSGANDISTNITFDSSAGPLILPVRVVVRRPNIVVLSAANGGGGSGDAPQGLMFHEGFASRMLTVSNPSDLPLAVCLMLDDAMDFKLAKPLRSNSLTIGMLDIIPPGGRKDIGPILFTAQGSARGWAYIRNNLTILERVPLLGEGPGGASTLIFLLDGVNVQQTFRVRNPFRKPLQIRGILFPSVDSDTSRFSVNEVLPVEVAPGGAFIIKINYKKMDNWRWQEDMLISTSMGELFVQLVALATDEPSRWNEPIVPFLCGAACVLLAILVVFHVHQKFLLSHGCSQPKPHPMSKIFSEPETVMPEVEPDDSNNGPRPVPRLRARAHVIAKTDPPTLRTVPAVASYPQSPEPKGKKNKKAKSSAKKQHQHESDDLGRTSSINGAPTSNTASTTAASLGSPSSALLKKNMPPAYENHLGMLTSPEGDSAAALTASCLHSPASRLTPVHEVTGEPLAGTAAAVSPLMHVCRKGGDVMPSYGVAARTSSADSSGSTVESGKAKEGAGGKTRDKCMLAPPHVAAEEGGSLRQAKDLGLVSKDCVTHETQKSEEEKEEVPHSSPVAAEMVDSSRKGKCAIVTDAAVAHVGLPETCSAAAENARENKDVISLVKESPPDVKQKIKVNAPAVSTGLMSKESCVPVETKNRKSKSDVPAAGSQATQKQLPPMGENKRKTKDTPMTAGHTAAAKDPPAAWDNKQKGKHALLTPAYAAPKEQPLMGDIKRKCKEVGVYPKISTADKGQGASPDAQNGGSTRRPNATNASASVNLHARNNKSAVAAKLDDSRSVVMKQPLATEKLQPDAKAMRPPVSQKASDYDLPKAAVPHKEHPMKAPPMKAPHLPQPRKPSNDPAPLLMGSANATEEMKKSMPRIPPPPPPMPPPGPPPLPFPPLQPRSTNDDGVLIHAIPPPPLPPPPPQRGDSDDDDEDNFDFLRPPPNIDEEPTIAPPWDDMLQHLRSDIRAPSSHFGPPVASEPPTEHFSAMFFPSAEENPPLFPPSDKAPSPPIANANAHLQLPFPSFHPEYTDGTNYALAPSPACEQSKPISVFEDFVSSPSCETSPAKESAFDLRYYTADPSAAMYAGAYNEHHMPNHSMDEHTAAEYAMYQQNAVHYHHIQVAHQQQAQQHLTQHHYGDGMAFAFPHEPKEDLQAYNAEFYSDANLAGVGFELAGDQNMPAEYLYEASYMHDMLGGANATNTRQKRRRRANNLRRAKEKKKKHMEEQESLVSNHSQSEGSNQGCTPENFALEQMRIARPRWPEGHAEGGNKVLEGLLADLHRGSQKVESVPSRHQWNCFR